MCTTCGLKPSDVGSDADAIVCNSCEKSANLEKNPYLAHGKFPFKIGRIGKNVEKVERYVYLKQVMEYIDESSNQNTEGKKKESQDLYPRRKKSGAIHQSDKRTKEGQSGLHDSSEKT